ncbi:alpha/beta fold hydrolase [Telmatospirillum sp. J64-1]|uniref:alpha/beta fold hydrolase n=1 Tax=Telmatospirillum sp. J64-1 TaxID=2502183 RepID=UPI00163D64EF|nr:alpha/beta hydrolase [Telmatospirillum sp. J64-1]
MRASSVAGVTLAGAAAAALGWHAVQRTRRAEEQYPPQGRFISVDGVRLHYLDRGEGPPLVTIHGAGSMIPDIAGSPVYQELVKSHRILSFDRPGYGYSERSKDRRWTARAQARLLHEAMDKLGVKRPLVLAHSWGCMPALALALTRPAPVAGLILMGGYYYPTFHPAVPLVGLFRGGPFSHVLSGALGRRMAWNGVRSSFWPDKPCNFDHFPLDIAAAPSRMGALGEDFRLLMSSAASLAPHYPEINLPMVILAGTADKVVDYRVHALRLHRDIPHAQLCLLPGTGHHIHYVCPDQVLGAVERTGRWARQSW